MRVCQQMIFFFVALATREHIGTTAADERVIAATTDHHLGTPISGGRSTRLARDLPNDVVRWTLWMCVGVRI